MSEKAKEQSKKKSGKTSVKSSAKTSKTTNKTKSSEKNTAKTKQKVKEPKPKKVRAPKPKKKLKIIPLGGLLEIGKNMTAFEYGNDIIIVDVGMAFGGDDTPGVDCVIQDYTYIRDNAHKLRGIINCIYRESE